MPDGDTAESSPENTLVIKSCLKIGLKRQRGSDGERERERERQVGLETACKMTN